MEMITCQILDRAANGTSPMAPALSLLLRSLLVPYALVPVRVAGV